MMVDPWLPLVSVIRDTNFVPRKTIKLHWTILSQSSLPKRITTERKLITVTDILGRPIKNNKNQVVIYIYSDGTVEKKFKYDK